MSLSFADAAKARELREYFNRYGRIYVVVDATGDDVIVPDNLKGDPALRLVLSLRMPQQIHIRDDRLDSDFSFSGQVFPCRIPMHTIWAAYQPEGELEQGIIWEDSVPEMIKSMVEAARGMADDESEELAGQAEANNNEAAVSPMTVIDGGAGTDTDDEPRERKASHLRVVK